MNKLLFILIITISAYFLADSVTELKTELKTKMHDRHELINNTGK